MDCQVSKKKREETGYHVAPMDNQPEPMKHRFLIFIFTAILAPLVSAQDPFGEPAFLTKETTATIKPQVTQIEPGDFL